ncbi:MAG: efflux RND transporter periplasmic adaptor subunit [Idiomarina sp.]|nr:efflux RND transporter periplasmic adaptor subunit [Idiomarina sp.]
MKPLILFAFASSLLLGLVACSESTPQSETTENKIPVSEALVVTRDLSQSFQVSAQLQAYRQAHLGSRMLAFVNEVAVEEGDQVEQGASLAQLDVREYAAQLLRAEAIAEEADDVMQRTERLHAQGSASEAELRRADREARQARSEVERLQLYLEYGDVRAPFEGVITERHIDPGDQVDENTPLFTLQQHDLLVARPALSEMHEALVRRDDKVRVRFDTHPGIDFTGHIRRIFPTVDVQTRLFRVEVAVEQQQEYPVRPGYLARVTFFAGEYEDVISVPSDALVSEGQRHFVFVIDNGRVERREVDVGVRRDGFAQIRSGLALDERVAAANLDELADGSAIDIVARFRRRGFSQ